MTTKEKWLWFYKVVRSVLFSAVVFVAAIFIGLYMILSLPAVQDRVRRIAETELSEFIGIRVEIGEVSIHPFNEVTVSRLDVYQPDGQLCLHAEKVGAGISLWHLIADRSIVVTYAELLGLRADIRQETEGAPLNIRFLIDAFAPKDKNKPPVKFDLQIRNIVIRKSTATFSREWKPRLPDDRIDFNHLSVTALNADVTIPRLSNDLIEIDLRRLAMQVNSLLDIERLTLLALIDHGNISISGFQLRLPNSRLSLNDLKFPLADFGGSFPDMVSHSVFDLNLRAEHLVPSEFSGFYPPLADWHTPFTLSIDAKGNSRDISIGHLDLNGRYDDLSLNIKGEATLGDKGSLSEISLSTLNLHAAGTSMSKIAALLPPNVSGPLRGMITDAGDLSLTASGKGSIERKMADADISIKSGYGNLDASGRMGSSGSLLHIDAKVATDGFSIGRLLERRDIGRVAFSLQGKMALDPELTRKGRSTGLETIDRINMMLPEGELHLALDNAELRGELIHDVTLDLRKTPVLTDLDVSSNDPDYDLSLNAEIHPDGQATQAVLQADINRLDPHLFLNSGRMAYYTYSGLVDIDISGNRADNLAGHVGLSRLQAISPAPEKKNLNLDNLDISASLLPEGDGRNYSIRSDWFDLMVDGTFLPTQLPKVMRGLLADVTDDKTFTERLPEAQLTYNLNIYPEGDWADFFNLPVTLLYQGRVHGSLDSSAGFMTLNVDAPYIRQGRDKLIQHTSLKCRVNEGKASADLYSSIPTKKGVLDLDASVELMGRHSDVRIGFNRRKQGQFYGDLQLTADIVSPVGPISFDNIRARLLPTKIWLNDAAWNIGDAEISYTPGRIDVSGFSVRHADQYVAIDGTASRSVDDEVNIRLNDIDLNYIFDTLNIDYVSFGGFASGEAVGRSLLSGKPEAFTRNLSVKGLSYNNSVLGDGDVYGDFDATMKRIGIRADIAEDGRRVALVDGGIWLGRDSLSFAIDADRVKVGFLQTFMQAFSSHVDGRGSGNALLYGTFKDIDLKGHLFADTIAMKVDYTNVVYSGRDSVTINPGHISIPSFRLYDQFGHSAILQGTLTHNCFHDPVFRFNVSDANDLLVYDTDSRMNSIWYGRIFGNGGGEISGHPGYVGIMADMTTRPGSTFTFVLSDEQEAMDYKFLTFTDSQKARAEEEARKRKLADETDPDAIVDAFNRRVAQEAAQETALYMDLRATITPAAHLTMVMDPVAGDKIKAIGEGAMNMTYSSEGNDLRMYGKYTLQQGIYNFSLQDLILRDFSISPGSSISFNGDPMNGILDIKAAYRVNTNLTDLDKSFANDRDLNRTNVPVDATLLVQGEMTQPEISFDVEFPTLNDEVTQKVRSIISSEDMMTRQIVYLLALNRFYTPEYMGGSSGGGEWASVASSTISSQLSNILGQLTDKVNIMPSLRSEKGDFSDLEVDLALSSRLFNNRLWINGNLGYRDRTNSSTTFIGDFDIEYLLHRNGNFRLKAYNHFNDQNYYLKSALTTQGIGVIFRKDFDRLFRRKRKITDR